MNSRSKEIIEEAISQGKWTWLEIDNNSNSLYLEFENLKLSSRPIFDNSYRGELAIRFGQNIYLALFFNKKEDLSFLRFDDDYFNQLIDGDAKLTDRFPYFYQEFSKKLMKFKFQDFDYLNEIISSYSNRMDLVVNRIPEEDNRIPEEDNGIPEEDNGIPEEDNGIPEEDKRIQKEETLKENENFDFLLCFECEDTAIAVGGDYVNCFNDFESLNDDEIKRVSNNWILYYLDYWNKKGTEKEYEEDLLCEEFPLK